jgi:hypothetical protein
MVPITPQCSALLVKADLARGQLEVEVPVTAAPPNSPDEGGTKDGIDGSAAAVTIRQHRFYATVQLDPARVGGSYSTVTLLARLRG